MSRRRSVGLRDLAAVLLNPEQGIRGPGRLILRVTGLALPAVVALSLVVATWSEEEGRRVAIWCVAYLLYTLALEAFRRMRERTYEQVPMRVLRVLLNIVLLCWLIAISGPHKLVLWVFCLLPILSAILYFDRWEATSATWAGVALGLYLAGRDWATSAPLTIALWLAIVLLLGLMGTLLHWAFDRFVRMEIVLKVATELHRSLDLNTLLGSALRLAKEVIGGDRALVIVVDPEDGTFHWERDGLPLRPGMSAEELAEKCTVLKDGEPFRCEDLPATFGSRSIYHRFFDCNPRSVLAEPIFNRRGDLLGVISVTHDLPRRFGQQSVETLRLLSIFLGTAVDNCLIHRHVRLREARKDAVSARLARAGAEEEVVNVLAEEACALIPSADGSVVHRLEPRTGELIPWSATPYEVASLGRSRMRIGEGVAGHALELRRPVVIPVVKDHPWFADSERSPEFQALAVAPIIDEDAEHAFGTVSVYSKTPGAFSEGDEAVLVSLCSQAAAILRRLKDYANAVQRTSLLERILSSLLQIDVNLREEDLCQRIADLACELFGFRMSRVRLHDPTTDELVTVATSGLPAAESRSLLGHRAPVREFEPLFAEEFRVGRAYLIPHGHTVWQCVPVEHFYKASDEFYGPDWGPCHALLAPIEVRPGDPIGLLSLDVPEDRRCPPPHVIDAIGVFAAAAGWVIDRARSTRSLHEQQQRTETLLRLVSAELAKTCDLDVMGEVAVRFAAELLQAEGCSLHLVGEDNLLELTHSTHLAGTEYIGRKKPIGECTGCGLVAWVAATGRSLRLRGEEVKKHPAWAGETAHLKYLESGQSLSTLAVPVLDSRGRVIGVLHAENKKGARRDKGFTRRDEDLLRFVAEQVGNTIEKASLYDMAESLRRESLEDDVHELINWYHAGVVLPLEALQVWCDRNDFQQVMEMLPQLIDRARTTLFELKTIHTAIFSRYLEMDSLDDALRRIASAWRLRAGFPQPIEDIRVEIDAELPARIRSVLLRIAALAIGNAVIHSGVENRPDGRIWVQLGEEADGSVRLEVGDNGKGFERSRQGYGITRMWQLAHQVKGQLQIETAPGEGTRVIVRLPLGDDLGEGNGAQVG